MRVFESINFPNSESFLKAAVLTSDSVSSKNWQ